MYPTDIFGETSYHFSFRYGEYEFVADLWTADPTFNLLSKGEKYGPILSYFKESRDTSILINFLQRRPTIPNMLRVNKYKYINI